MESESNKLEILRNELRDCDERLLELLHSRFVLSERLGREKLALGLAAHQEGEWQRKVQLLTARSRALSYRDEVLRVFQTIHHESVKVQKRVFGSDGSMG